MADKKAKSKPDPEAAEPKTSIFDLFEPPPENDPSSFGKIPVIKEDEIDLTDGSTAEDKAAADAEAAGLQHWTAPPTGQVPAVLGSDKDQSGLWADVKGPSWHGDDPSWAGPDLADVFADTDSVSLDGSDEFDEDDEEFEDEESYESITVRRPSPPASNGRPANTPAPPPAKPKADAGPTPSAPTRTPAPAPTPAPPAPIPAPAPAAAKAAEPTKSVFDDETKIPPPARPRGAPRPPQSQPQKLEAPAQPAAPAPGQPHPQPHAQPPGQPSLRPGQPRPQPQSQTRSEARPPLAEPTRRIVPPQTQTSAGPPARPTPNGRPPQVRSDRQDPGRPERQVPPRDDVPEARGERTLSGALSEARVERQVPPRAPGRQLQDPEPDPNIDDIEFADEYYEDEEDDLGFGHVGGRNLPQAIGVGLALAGVVLAAMWFGPYTTLLLVVVLALLAVLELYNAMRMAGLRPATLLGIVGTVAAPAAAYYRGDSAFPLIVALAVVFGTLWYLVGADTERPVLNLSLTMMGIFWVGGLAAFGALMLRQDGGIELLLATIIITVASDTMAYIGGRAYGSRPFHHASPNKTWEGTITGFIGAVFAGFAIGVTEMGSIWDTQLVAAIALGAVVGCLAPMGDLAESVVKRDLGVKDMGTLLPGHGGVLDRVDGLLFALPGAYYLALVYSLI